MVLPIWVIAALILIFAIAVLIQVRSGKLGEAFIFSMVVIFLPYQLLRQLGFL